MRGYAGELELPAAQGVVSVASFGQGRADEALTHQNWRTVALKDAGLALGRI